MTRTLLVRNKQPQHSLPGTADKQTSKPKNKKIRRKRATVAPYSRRKSPGNRLSTRWARAIMKKLELEQLRKYEQD